MPTTTRTSSSTVLKQIQGVFDAMTTLRYCSGSVPLEPSTSHLFYLNAGKSGFVDFEKPTEAQLVALAETCQPETFGRSKDVLDKSCHKVGKMDTSQFATLFSPLTNGIIGSVKSGLLQAELDVKSIRLELCKLNVYGPGSFVKARVDKSCGKEISGSLVVIFPTVHQGGSLALRQGREKKVFDTAHTVNSQDMPHAAFVAFFNDFDHEVALVKSGYRVTLTYNLYLTDSTAETLASGPKVDNAINERVTELQGLMKKLFRDQTFLPDGGYFGFGLLHKYSFNRSPSSDLGQVANNLKGSDYEVKRVCDALGLDLTLKVSYSDREAFNNSTLCLLDSFFNFNLPEPLDELTILDYIYEVGKNSIIVHPNNMPVDRRHENFEDIGDPIVWLREITKTNAFNSSYMEAYDSKTTVSTVPGNLCLVVEVAKAAKRVY